MAFTKYAFNTPDFSDLVPLDPRKNLKTMISLKILAQIIREDFWRLFGEKTLEMYPIWKIERGCARLLPRGLSAAAIASSLVLGELQR